MKKILLLGFVAMMSLACTPRKNNESVDVNESSVVIDVRTDGEFEGGHLEGAINIPHTEIAEKIAGFVENKDESITLYCRSGYRSKLAKKTLEGVGYTSVTDAGAYANLK